jgi:hypothetical protein
MTAEGSKIGKGPDSENASPEPESTGVQPEQTEGRVVIAEILGKKGDERGVSLSVHPLLAAITGIGSGVRSAALGILQYLIGELSRKDEELRTERSRSTELERQLRAEQTARVRAEARIEGLERTRRLGNGLIVFGGILLGFAGILYSSSPTAAIALAIIDALMTLVGVLL